MGGGFRSSLLNIMRYHHHFLYTTFMSITLVLFLALPAMADDILDIAKTPWGISRAQTGKLLDIKVPASIPPDGGLSVSGFELSGFDGDMGYVFFQDRLVEIHFSIDSAKQRDFTKKASTTLKERLERQFTRQYGTAEINNQQCDNVENCRYSLWYKNDSTAVGLYTVKEIKGRNLAISFMQRKSGETSYSQFGPKKGLTIIPPNETQKNALSGW